MAEFFWREGLLCPGFVMIGSAFRRANVTKGRSRYLPEAERCPDETLVSLAYGVPTAIGAESKARTGQCVFRAGGGGQPRDTFCQAFYPLTMPLTVGPRSISVAITLGANASLITRTIL
jgi:hypothetical protein